MTHPDASRNSVRILADLLLVGAALASFSLPASAHPVQLDCGADVGYTATGPTFGNPNSWWIATVGTGGACVDYPYACFYDPVLGESCDPADARHPVPVPFCRSCLQ